MVHLLSDWAKINVNFFSVVKKEKQHNFLFSFPSGEGRDGAYLCFFHDDKNSRLFLHAYLFWRFVLG